MGQEINKIIADLQEVVQGDPWYGESVMAVLEKTDPNIVYIQPAGTMHSMADILYHICTWTEFAAQRLESKPLDIPVFEQMNWIKIDPATHSWEKGIEHFKDANERIISILNEKEDNLLVEKVDYHDYNFGYLLNGLIQHHVYHLGQLAYIRNLCAGHS